MSDELHIVKWQPSVSDDGRQKIFEVFDKKHALIESYADVDEAIAHAKEIKGLVQLVVIETVACFYD